MPLNQVHELNEAMDAIKAEIQKDLSESVSQTINNEDSNKTIVENP